MQIQELPQTASASEFKVNPNTIFDKAADGPVMILSRATQKAVVVSPEHWNELARELKRLQHLELCDWVSREMDDHPSTSAVVTGDQLVELHRG